MWREPSIPARNTSDIRRLQSNNQYNKGKPRKCAAREDKSRDVSRRMWLTLVATVENSKTVKIEGCSLDLVSWRFLVTLGRPVSLLVVCWGQKQWWRCFKSGVKSEEVKIFGRGSWMLS